MGMPRQHQIDMSCVGVIVPNIRHMLKHYLVDVGIVDLWIHLTQISGYFPMRRTETMQPHHHNAIGSTMPRECGVVAHRPPHLPLLRQ